MNRRLIVGPFNRVEGDLEVRLDVSDGQVAAAFVSAPLFRGFEQILLGRPAADALAIAPRVCGICSIAQSSAAARALAAAAGVAPPPNGRRVADILLACENAADHLTHFYLFFMPDFARACYRGRPWHEETVSRFAALKGEAAKAATAARTEFLHIFGILAGKWPHSLAIQPGGSTKSVDLGERMRLLAILAEFRRFLEQRTFGDRLENLAGLDCPDALDHWRRTHSGDFALFLAIAEDLRLAEWGRGPDRFLSLGRGLLRSGTPAPVDLAALREDLSHSWLDGGALHPGAGVTTPAADKADGYSWAKAPRLAGESFEVGAVARQMIAGNPLMHRLVGAADGRGNVRDRVVARLLELAQLVGAIEAELRGLADDGAFCLPAGTPARAEAAGLVEAARGSLGHWLKVEQGRIAGYQIVAPTTWNFSPRDAAGAPGPLEQALVGAPVEKDETEPALVQHIVRSFDPCMSCTVH
jgi:Ni,Fe-hydrogenase I large subunit